MIFQCDKCDKVFTTKQHLQNHILRKACKILTHYCKYCSKGFTTESSMYRHMRQNCETKKESDKEKDSIYARLVKLEEDNKELKENNKDLQQNNQKLQKRINMIEKKSVKTGKITNNNLTNNGNIIVANINLVGYGNEDISKIDRSDMVKVLQKGYNSAVGLTETLHFNPKHPEYHNVYITNMKDKYAMMYDGKNWNLTMKDDLIDKIYDDKKNYIEENLDDFVDSLSISRKKALDRWLESSDDDEKIDKIKDEIKLLLYNKRSFVEQKKIKVLKAPKDK